MAGVGISRIRRKRLFQLTHKVVPEMVSDHIYGNRVRDDIDKYLLLLPLRLRYSCYILRDKELKIRRLI